jgi:hypothetical protein
VINAYNLKGF